MLRTLRNLFVGVPSATPLFDAVVASARKPHWYIDAKVPDTVEGRFAVLASLTALVNLRLEAGSSDARNAAVALAESFIADMDAQVRQMGVGDPSIAKQVGAMVGSLGLRVGRFRSAITGSADWREVVEASLYPSAAAPSQVALVNAIGALKRYWEALEASPEEAVISGTSP